MVNDDDEAETERRVREKAHRLWEAEGRPHGRADAHWTAAREMVAIEDSLGDTLEPLPERSGEPVEPRLALENQGGFPDLADQGEQAPPPSYELAAEHRDDRPETPPRPRRADLPGAKSDAVGQFAASRAVRDNDGLASAAPGVLTGDGDATQEPQPARGTRRKSGKTS